MCGITGYFGEGDKEILHAMTTVLTRRGPDDEGSWISEDKCVGLGFRRLSIIDVAGGHQPMTGEDGTVHVVFNGEIYNYKELRDELVALGHRFTTTSDTEAIVHGYEAWGNKVFERLWGMFGIAIFDEKTKTLLLARDRMGKKPIYYGQYGSTFVFGSEPKAILAHPQASHELDQAAVSLYFIFECVPAPLAIWQGMRKLEPGCYLEFQNGNTKIEKFWKLEIQENKNMSEADAAAQLDELLRDAVRRRLVSDVPLGVFLSGGIDSSTIAWYAAEARQGIETFTIGFEESSYDESSDAERVAKHLGTTHHATRLSAKDALGIIPSVYAYLDEPLADPSIIPTALLSRFTRERVTVAVGGDGGDELFQGYPTFWAHELADRYGRFVPQPIAQGFAAAATRVSGAGYMSFGFKLARMLRGISERDPLRRDLLFRGACTPEAVAKITNNRPNLATLDQYRGHGNDLSALYFRAYLMDTVMTKVDRASMMMSLEARAPFLDHRVVEFVNSLPVRLKRRGRHGKLLLKTLMHGRIPDETFTKRKQGFTIPVASWLRGELKQTAEDAIRAVPIINQQEASRILDAHARGADHRKELWTLFSFALWYDQFVHRA